MIARMRSEFDGDFPNELRQNSMYRTETQSQEIRCSVCGKWIFVDDAAFREIEMHIKQDCDNQFVCEDCELDFQDTAYG